MSEDKLDRTKSEGFAFAISLGETFVAGARGARSAEFVNGARELVEALKALRDYRHKGAGE